jgi:hypothetical protein
MTDSCPACLCSDVSPAATCRRGDRIVHGYRCPGCGHEWATARDLPSYSDLHRRPATRPARKAS